MRSSNRMVRQINCSLLRERARRRRPSRTFSESLEVLATPIERGGGMKVKVVEAMMHGIPVVATQHAMDGLPQAIAEECIKWVSLPSGWRRSARKSGRRGRIGTLPY